MAGFRNGAYATVWEVKPSNNYTDVRLSISRKKLDGTYETDFSGFVRFISDAHTKAAALNERDRIKIIECACTNRYDKSKGVTYYNFQVFNFDQLNNDAPSRPQAATFVNVQEETITEELPFA